MTACGASCDAGAGIYPALILNMNLYHYKTNSYFYPFRSRAVSVSELGLDVRFSNLVPLGNKI